MKRAPRIQPLSDLYARRRVAERDARACAICHRPTTVVLVNEVAGADHFYACESHLTDLAFARPVPKPIAAGTVSTVAGTGTTDKTPDAEAKNKDTAIEDEIARLKKEWEEVKSQSTVREPPAQPGNLPKPKTELAKVEAPQNEVMVASAWFKLDNGILSLRNAAKRRQIMAQQARQQLQDPNFPSTPKHAPS